MGCCHPAPPETTRSELLVEDDSSSVKAINTPYELKRMIASTSGLPGGGDAEEEGGYYRGGGSFEEMPPTASQLLALDTSATMCSVGCGRPVKPGLTRKGNPYNTCCRSCSVNPGLGMHDHNCGLSEQEAARESAGPPARPACTRGSRCRQRDREHLAAQAHPLDEDYTESCTASRVEPEKISLKVIFDWADADGSGKLSQKELYEAYFPIQRRCGGALPPITNEAWAHMDEDGNGVVNFVEFASWAGPRLGLPLGMESMMKRLSTNKSGGFAPCSVLGCPCEAFDGDDAHPSTKCRTCKHKCGVHKHRSKGGEVPLPEYWQNHDEQFLEMVELNSASVIDEFQKLLDKTYRPTWTRDRTRHNPTRPLPPVGFKVVGVKRNENYENWKEFACRRAEIMLQIDERKAEGVETPIEIYSDVKSTAAWKEIAGKKGDRLYHECNEWYLFHGTSPAASKSICENDFKVACAGSNTGTLYGKGLYFAESITKADEYAKPDGGDVYAVLLCRVIGGNVRYTDEITPDPEELVYSCLDGPYDCVLGDREKCRNTYKEFVLFDSEDVYPEYVIEYKRVYK